MDPSQTRRAKPALSLTLAFACLALGLWTLLRLLLLARTGPAELGFGGSARALLTGAWFDLATLAFLVAPALAARAFLPSSWLQSRPGRGLRLALLGLALAGLLLGVAAEYVFWDEFQTRANFIAVDYLVYTREVLDNIVESYPLGAILGILALASGLAVLALGRTFELGPRPRSMRERLGALALALLLPSASLTLARLEQMEAPGPPAAGELAGNGLFTFMAAFRRNELDYDRFYPTLPQSRADAILRGLGVARAALAGAVPRSAPASPCAQREAGRLPAPFLRRPRNVVLVSVESLSASFVGALGGAAGLTPNLDRMMGEGYTFTRCFATGTRTVRGLEALSLGTPPVPGQAIVRRPHNEHLATLGELLEHQGFATYFLYGGYGYFDNMNAYFAGNDYTVVDRTDIPAGRAPFANAWGVADEFLFDEALEVLDHAHQAGKPFLAHLMTTSNHRPFTYPDGRIDVPSPGGRDGAVKYSDWALGDFLGKARARAWFRDTLFVVVADHCASAAGRTRLPLDRYRIPLVLWGPDLLRPGTDDRVASQIDLAPTLLDVLGKPHRDEFFGESLLRPECRHPRAFISTYQELGYYKDGLLTILRPHGEAEAQRVDPATLAGRPARLDPALLEEAIAYYQTASRAFKQGALASPDYRTVRSHP